MKDIHVNLLNTCLFWHFLNAFQNSEMKSFKSLTFFQNNEKYLFFKYTLKYEHIFPFWNFLYFYKVCKMDIRIITFWTIITKMFHDLCDIVISKLSFRASILYRQWCTWARRCQNWKLGDSQALFDCVLTGYPINSLRFQNFIRKEGIGMI